MVQSCGRVKPWWYQWHLLGGRNVGRLYILISLPNAIWYFIWLYDLYDCTLNYKRLSTAVSSGHKHKWGYFSLERIYFSYFSQGNFFRYLMVTKPKPKPPETIKSLKRQKKSHISLNILKTSILTLFLFKLVLCEPPPKHIFLIFVQENHKGNFRYYFWWSRELTSSISGNNLMVS